MGSLVVSDWSSGNMVIFGVRSLRTSDHSCLFMLSVLFCWLYDLLLSLQQIVCKDFYNVCFDHDVTVQEPCGHSDSHYLITSCINHSSVHFIKTQLSTAQNSISSSLSQRSFSCLHVFTTVCNKPAPWSSTVDAKHFGEIFQTSMEFFQITTYIHTYPGTQDPEIIGSWEHRAH